jgi:CheY-like chemotaxis protein
MTTKEIKVLIVDDSKNIRKLISVVLGKIGYTYVEAGNGLDALEKVEIERPDLVVLDIIIPGVNGLKVCEEIRKNPKTKDIGIIILTSEATYEARELAHKAGADVFMIKPFEPNDLRAAAKEVLERRSCLNS